MTTIEPPDDGFQHPPVTADLQPETIKYLQELASESFDRQVELDESVWRSLPFFGAALAVAVAVVGRAASDAPPPEWTVYVVCVYILLAGAVAAFGWTIRWFWVVVRAREYEYPSADAEVRAYAQAVTEFHATTGAADAILDDRVLGDLRLFMIDQYAGAAKTNLRHNAERLGARSQVLLFILVGFAFAFCCEATIFIRNAVQQLPSEQQGRDNVRNSPPARPAAAPIRPVTAGTPETAPYLRGRRVWKIPRGTLDKGKMMADKPPAPSPPPPGRPTPPPSQTLIKTEKLPKKD